MKLFRTIFAFTLMAASLSMTAATAATSSTAIEIASSRKFALSCEDSGPYCGIYCLYVAADLQNHPLKLKDVLNDKYIGSQKKGSSVQELCDCAGDFGLQAQLYDEMSINELRKIHAPMILHVKAFPGDREYDHYILYAGDLNGDAKIFDPQDSAKIIKYGELEPLWDGIGIEISSANSHEELKPSGSNINMFMLYVIVALGVFVLASRFRNIIDYTNQPHAGSALFGILIIAIVAALGSAIIQAREGGMFQNTDAVLQIIASHGASFIPKIHYEDVRNLNPKETLVIDARHAEDFTLEHIPGAHNIPVSMSQPLIRREMAGIAPDQPIIIYCMNSSCPFSDTVADELIADGFRNLKIYRGGWDEWKQKESSFDTHN